MKQIAFKPFRQYKEAVRLREMEEHIPDALFQAASFPAGHSMEKIIEYLSKSNMGALGKEFKQALNEIQKGASVEKSIEHIQGRNNSEVVQRAMALLLYGYESGSDLSALFRETAEDILETKSILQERNASLTIQKYTILLGGAVLVPSILGAVVKLSQSLSVTPIASFLGEGLSATQRSELLQFSLWGTQAYIIEYALIASLFVAWIEGNQKKWVWYAIALIPISWICFNAVQWMV